MTRLIAGRLAAAVPTLLAVSLCVFAIVRLIPGDPARVLAGDFATDSVIEELPEKGIVKYGKPAGIIACIVPTTNPDLTPAGNAIYGIKARDVVIFSPHPRSKKTSFETVRLMREALEREGAPVDILQCLTKVNIPMSQALMARADLIVATGGQPMVRAAYSSGTPAYGSPSCAFAAFMSASAASSILAASKRPT